MAPTHSDGGSGPDPTTGGGRADEPEQWGVDGMVGEGRYRLTRRLGRGGMAEVFAAEDVRLGRTVAIKLLRADLAADQVARARFAREAQAVAGLNHHAVVAVYDSGEDLLPTGETAPFMVMELVNGRTVRELLVNAEAPPVEQALTIVSGVLAALSYSHQRGIVHRDIKPANVIITTDGAVKVMDFGIARALHAAGSTMTQTGMVMGTPQYLSPEQALGRAVDTRSDLYATGCMLFELLALRPPFVGETPLAVVYQHVQDLPLPPSELSERVPPELDGLVLRALAKEPDDRYQSAEEMAGEIDYALRMLATEGGHTGTWSTGHVALGDPTAPVGAAPAPDDTPVGEPLLIGPPGNGGRRGGRRRGRRAVLVAVAAVLAVCAGVFAAVNGARDDSPGGNPGTGRSHAPKESSVEPRESGVSPSPNDDASVPVPDDGWTEPETDWDPTGDPSPSFSPSTPSETEPTDDGGVSAPPTHSTPPDDTTGGTSTDEPPPDPDPTDTGPGDDSTGTTEGGEAAGTTEGGENTTGSGGTG